MTIAHVAVIPGDGIGPEVIEEGVKVVDAALSAGEARIDWEYFDYSADYYLKEGKLLDDYDLKKLEGYDAIYLGAVGDPRIPTGILEEGFLLKLRFYLDQYINLRPVKLYEGVEGVLKNKNSRDIDMVFIRENSEDFYSGLGALIQGGREVDTNLLFRRRRYKVDFDVKSRFSIDKGMPESYGYQIGVITEMGSERIQRYAFEYAKRIGFGKVASVDKANVMPEMYGLWRKAFDYVSREYPDVSSEKIHADAAAMWLVKNPENFKVLVLPNLFGDVLSDLGASLQGGLGFAPGGNINPEGVSMFEPIHGSAPKYKGKKLVNPVAAILAGKMMLETLGLQDSANRIEEAVSRVLKEGKVRTRDMNGKNSTNEMGDEIAKVVSSIDR